MCLVSSYIKHCKHFRARCILQLISRASSVSLVSCETLKAFSDFSRSRATKSRVEKFSVCFSYQLFGEKKAAKKLQVFSQRVQSFSQSEVKIREFGATAERSGQTPDKVDCQSLETKDRGRSEKSSDSDTVKSWKSAFQVGFRQKRK